MRLKTRRERVEWIKRKLGIDFAVSLYLLTDREIKRLFDELYPRYRDKPDYKQETKHPTCLTCGREVVITWTCMCGENEAVIEHNEEPEGV